MKQLFFFHEPPQIVTEVDWVDQIDRIDWNWLKWTKMDWTEPNESSIDYTDMERKKIWNIYEQPIARIQSCSSQ